MKPSYAADKIESDEGITPHFHYFPLPLPSPLSPLPLLPSLIPSPSPAHQNINKSFPDHKKSQQIIEKESEVAARNAQQLAAYRRPLVRLVAMLHDRDATPRDDKDKEKEKEKPKEKEKEKEKEKDKDSKEKDKDSKDKGEKEEKTERDRDSSSILSTITISASDSQTLSLARVNKRVALLALLYGKECKSVFESLSKAVQVMIAAKRELVLLFSCLFPLTSCPFIFLLYCNRFGICPKEDPNPRRKRPSRAPPTVATGARSHALLRPSRSLRTSSPAPHPPCTKRLCKVGSWRAYSTAQCIRATHVCAVAHAQSCARCQKIVRPPQTRFWIALKPKYLFSLFSSLNYTSF